MKRLDRAWVIVAFHFERDRPAVPDIDYAGVFFTGLYQNVRAARWKFSELAPRVLVGAMLTPHDRENPELGEIRLPTQNFFDSLEFFRRQAVFRHQLRSNFRIGGRGARHRQPTLANARPDSTRELFRFLLIFVFLLSMQTKIKT